MGKQAMLAVYREAFNQYLSRYGVPLPSPSHDIRAGDLVVFKLDGTCLKLTSIYDEKPKYTKETSQIDPIVSNGMRSRSLTPEERSLYTFPADSVKDISHFSRDYLKAPDFAIAVSTLTKTEIKEPEAKNWINSHVREINQLLDRFKDYDPEYGLILVTERWSAKKYCRIEVPSKNIEQGVILGISSDGQWVEGFKPGERLSPYSKVDLHNNGHSDTLFVNGLSIKSQIGARTFLDTLLCVSKEVGEKREHFSVKHIHK